MWAHGDMKIQIPQFLGLTQIQIPQFLGLTHFVGAVCGMHHGCGPAPSAGAFYAEAGFVLVAS